MNEWDRNNLHFILDSDEETLEDFYSWATTDDLAYALSLVREARTELLIQEADILDEILTNATIWIKSWIVYKRIKQVYV